MAFQPLHTDTVAQANVAQGIGDTAHASTATLNAIMDEVHGLQAHLNSETGNQTQLKAAQLNDAGTALMRELTSISERVGVAATGYGSTDADGAAGVASSAGAAF